MASRLELQAKLKTIISNVYFDPPETVKIQYPCIVYSKKPCSILKADDKIYKLTDNYEVIFIDKDPDSIYPDLILSSFDYIRPTNYYSYDNLHHYTFTLYF